MDRKLIAGAAALVFLSLVSCRKAPDFADEPAAPQVARGAVHGRVRATAPLPVNDTIRMNADPMCAKANGESSIVDEAVVAGEDGGLTDAFVELVGDFPDTPVPGEPVSIDQRGCLYRPRVVGLRAGQALVVRNSDDGLHNVHGIAAGHDGFNVSQPVRGMTTTFHPGEPGILQLKCDVHTWMIAFVGVATHPYFAVTGAGGTFDLRDVPAGTWDLRVWHERLGTITTTVHVDGNGTADVDAVYPAGAHAEP